MERVSEVSTLTPARLTSLYSSEGSKILTRVYLAGKANKRMVDVYTKQLDNVSCGIASLALVINAINVAYRIKYSLAAGDEDKLKEFYEKHRSGYRFMVTESDIKRYGNVQGFLQSTSYASSGLTLQQLQTVASTLGLGSNVYFACKQGDCQNLQTKLESSLAENAQIFNNTNSFRKFAQDYITRRITGIIVNFDMSKLGYENYPGHFSPIAGYDVTQDRFLVMDVWKDTDPVWVKTEDLFNAMATVDNDSGFPRGMLHVHELLY